MVNEGKGNLFKRKDGKYLIYLPEDLVEDGMFPFKDFKKTKRGVEAIPLKINFKIGDNKLTIEKWKETQGN